MMASFGDRSLAIERDATVCSDRTSRHGDLERRDAAIAAKFAWLIMESSTCGRSLRNQRASGRTQLRTCRRLKLKTDTSASTAARFGPLSEATSNCTRCPRAARAFASITATRSAPPPPKEGMKIAISLVGSTVSSAIFGVSDSDSRRKSRPVSVCQAQSDRPFRCVEQQCNSRKRSAPFFQAPQEQLIEQLRHPQRPQTFSRERRRQYLVRIHRCTPQCCFWFPGSFVVCHPAPNLRVVGRISSH